MPCRAISDGRALGVAGLTFGNGVIETFTRDTDNRITGVVANTASSAAVLNRTLAWTGETLDSIADNQFPGNTPPFTYTAQSQSLTYTPTHKLASAVGYYGSYAWAYDPTGNRTSETANSVASAYAYPSTSNQLASITPSGGTARNFSYDAAGDITTDSASVGGSGPAQTYEYDAEGRLAKTYQTATPTDGSAYSYDSDSRLSERIVTQTTAPTSTTILYAYDTNDHIIAELDASGQTLREYIWLNDMPVAVVDNVATTPVIYYVQVDHLMRPARMTDASANWVWDVIFTPFGTTAYINQNPTVMDIRFPGQWFQLETGLAYNWHRHYDATTGRYVQPDPLLSDDGETFVRGLLAISVRSSSAISLSDNYTKSTVGLIENSKMMPEIYPSTPIAPTGSSLYAYARQTPLTKRDRTGLASGPYTPLQRPLLPVIDCLADTFELTKIQKLGGGLYMCLAIGKYTGEIDQVMAFDPSECEESYIGRKMR